MCGVAENASEGIKDNVIKFEKAHAKEELAKLDKHCGAKTHRRGKHKAAALAEISAGEAQGRKTQKIADKQISELYHLTCAQKPTVIFPKLKGHGI